MPWVSFVTSYFVGSWLKCFAWTKTLRPLVASCPSWIIKVACRNILPSKCTVFVWKFWLFSLGIKQWVALITAVNTFLAVREVDHIILKLYLSITEVTCGRKVFNSYIFLALVLVSVTRSIMFSQYVWFCSIKVYCLRTSAIRDSNESNRVCRRYNVVCAIWSTLSFEFVAYRCHV